MEIEWVAKRAHLWRLLQSQPELTLAQLAGNVGMSPAWVQKWKARLTGVDGNDLADFMSRSRQRKTSPKQLTEAVEAKILHLREQLTEQYQRRVGARNILYHLQRDPDLKRLGVYVPQAASTVHEVLVRYQRIPRPAPRIHVPLEPAEPLQLWEMDFTDVITAHSTVSAKRQHQVEVFNVVDTGTSIALETLVSDQFDAQHALMALIEVLGSVGRPRAIRFDRDPRFVASWSMGDFPSALMRFLLCVGITPLVCPPRRPDRKPYVERFIRTQKEECLYPKRPATVPQAQHLLHQHRHFYNLERPSQAVTCHNQPPVRAAGELPRLPGLPQTVDPDAWLPHYHRQGFKRLVRSSGNVTVDNARYYIGKRYAGQPVMLVVDAPQKQFQVWLKRQPLKVCPIRHLFHGQLALDHYVDSMLQAAQSEEKRRQAEQRRRRLTG